MKNIKQLSILLFLFCLATSFAQPRGKAKEKLEQELAEKRKKEKLEQLKREESLRRQQELERIAATEAAEEAEKLRLFKQQMDAAKAAQSAGVGELVLNHIVPAIPSRFFYPAFLGDSQSHFNGPITVGEDGMLFSLPAGSKAIEKKSLM